MSPRLSALAAAAFVIPLLVVAACKRGERSGESDTIGLPASGSADCVALDTEAARRVSQVVSSHRTCTSDRECATIEQIDKCLGGCSLVVAATGIDAVRVALADVDRGPCEKFAQAACPRPVASCISVTPTCDGDRCRGRMLDGTLLPP
jgi:hypothetical protein